jgi:signal transduction histidine kinase
MSYRHKLRFRVFLSYPVLGFLISLFMVLFLQFAGEALERQFMENFLIEELEHFIELSDKDPDSVQQKSKNWVIFKVENDNTPPDMDFLSNFPEGTHDVEYKGKMYDLGVIKREKMQYYILYDDANFESLEHKLMIYLIAGCFIILWLTTWYGLTISKKVLEPITSLAAQIKTLDPENTSKYLVQNYAEDEVGILALEFDAFCERLHSLIRREREFTGNCSHELRTPLAVILAASENIATQKELPEHLKQKVLRIKRSAYEMSARLDVLLTLSRKQEEGEAYTDKIYLHTIIEQLITENQDLLTAEVKVVSDIQLSPYVKAPQSIAAMLMGNLIKNAFVYTKTGTVTINLQSNCFSVTDTGSGIAVEEVDKVFDRGFRGRESLGSGLGLNISKRICDHYGWPLEIKSEINKGTSVKWTFHVQ